MNHFVQFLSTYCCGNDKSKAANPAPAAVDRVLLDGLERIGLFCSVQRPSMAAVGAATLRAN